MFSTVTKRIGKVAGTGLIVATIGLGFFGSTGAVHAQPNNGGNGEAATCTYAGVTYSEGSKIKQGDGNIYRCSSDGTWILALVAPPGGKFNHVNLNGAAVLQAR